MRAPESLIPVLEQLCTVLEQLCQVEADKLTVISADHPDQLESLLNDENKLKKIKGGTDRLIRIRMKQLEQRLSGAKQSDPHVYDKYV